MSIEVILTCPLGSDCEKIVDGKIHRCRWYTRIAGKNPQTDEDVDEWNCAIAWSPILLVENANTNRGQTAAIESFRNEVVNQSAETNTILLTAAQIAQQSALLTKS